MGVAVVFSRTGTLHTYLALEIVFAVPKMRWKPHKSKVWNFYIEAIRQRRTKIAKTLLTHEI